MCCGPFDRPLLLMPAVVVLVQVPPVSFGFTSVSTFQVLREEVQVYSHSYIGALFIIPYLTS